MHESLHKKGIVFVIVIFPYAHQLKMDTKDNIIQNDLLSFCQIHEIPCLDLFPSYKQNSELIQWDNEGIHPDEGGHKIASEAIFNYLVEQQLISIKVDLEVRYE